MSELAVSWKGPYDLTLSLKAAASFSPGMAQETSALRTAVRIGGKPVLLEVQQDTETSGRVYLPGGYEQYSDELTKLAQWVLLADFDLRPFYRLTAPHPVLGPVAEQLHGLKPFRPASLFEMAVIAIIEQQISLTAAHRMRSRLKERFGDEIDGLWVFPEADTLSLAMPEELRACGLSGGKSEYVIGLSEKVTSGALDLDQLKTKSDDEARSVIMGLRGFGPWSAEYILVRGLGRPDAVPVDDLAVRSVAGKYLGNGSRMTSEEVAESLEPFRPFRGMTVFYLLAHQRLEGESGVSL